jgi:hypothetical protein
MMGGVGERSEGRNPNAERRPKPELQEPTAKWPQKGTKRHKNPKTRDFFRAFLCLVVAIPGFEIASRKAELIRAWLNGLGLSRLDLPSSFALEEIVVGIGGRA